MTAGRMPAYRTQGCVRSNALQNGTIRKSLSSCMAEATRERADPGVRGGIRCDLNWECLLVGRLVELAAAANVDRHGLPVCRPAQLVRATLFSDASAGEVWPLAKLLCCGARGYFLSHLRLCFSARALLHKSLDGRQLADRDRYV